MSDERAVAYDILRGIRRILRRVSEHSRALSRDAGLTVPQVLTLKALHEMDRDDVGLNILSTAIHLSPATTSGIVDRLVRANLVSRERGTIDRRRVHLALTDEGRRRVETLPTPLQERFVERLLNLQADEIAQLKRSLDRIVDMMDARDVDDSPILISDAEPI